MDKHFSDEYRTCFLCKRTETSYNRLEVHHLYQNGNRNKSDEYGLTVLLCADCHRLKPWAAHRSGKTMQYLHEYGQRLAQKKYGWTIEQFREVFGANYLQEEVEVWENGQKMK